MKLIDISTPNFPNTFVMVDDEDFERMNAFKWCPSNSKLYALREVRGNGFRKNVRMHRLIMEAKPGEVVDHINGEPLDNRRSNLRLCTIAQNCQNRHKQKPSSSGFRGVSSAEKGKFFQCAISSNNERIHLGLFVSAIEAAKAYNEAALKYHGEFAVLNVIPINTPTKDQA